MHTYQAKPDLLAGKIILVTGSGAGIGKEAAKTYAAHGATVILLGRTVKKLTEVYDEIVAAGHPEPAIYPLDLARANPDHYQDLKHKIDAEFGRLDGLLHNAAILGSLTPIEHYDIKQWYTVQQTNLNAPFLLTQAVISLLKKSKQASVIFTSANVGRQGKAYWGAYSISKAGNESLMQILADELENFAIRCNCINPGPTRTHIRSKAYPAEDAQEITPATEIMNSYLYLMGNDSVKVNGQSLNAQPSRQKHDAFAALSDPQAA